MGLWRKYRGGKTSAAFAQSDRDETAEGVVRSVLSVPRPRDLTGDSSFMQKGLVLRRVAAESQTRMGASAWSPVLKHGPKTASAEKERKRPSGSGADS